MNSDFTITFGSIFLAVLLFALLYVLGVGVVPLLKALTGVAEEKKAMVSKAITDIESSIASTPNAVTRTIHSVTSEMDFEPEQSAVLNLTEIINNGMKMGFKIMRETPEEISAEEVANAADKVAGFITRLTDAIPGNALTPVVTVTTEPPPTANEHIFG